jgi:NAD(P)-dependent dehydrogenase (short-subunit alcohol dehydrogenase family)
MRHSLNPFFLAGLGVGTATAAIALSRGLCSQPPPDRAVILITGGSRGLGLAIASRFAERRSATASSVRLVLAARDGAELQSAQDKLIAKHPHLHPDDFYLVAADLSHPGECRRLVSEAIARFGRIDVLVNNAGIIGVGPIEVQPLENFEQTMAINFFAALYTTWAALPHLRRQEPLPGWSRRAAIVNIGSIGGKIAVPHMLPYSAAKFALVGFSQGLHAELRAKGIRVTTVCPGLMRTGGEDYAQFFGDTEAEARWFKFSAKTPALSTTAEHAANRIYRAVAHGSAEIIITPQAWLAARFAGLCPNSTQCIAALANDHLLPKPPRGTEISE